MKNFGSYLVTGAFAILTPLAAQAIEVDTAGTIVKPAPVVNKEERAMHVGALGGLTNTDSNSNFEYGVDVGFQPYIPFGAGAEISKTDTGDLSRIKTLARGTYNFGGVIPVIRHSYVGAAAGMVFDRSTDIDGNWLASGPLAGFDIPVRQLANDRSVTLGAQAQYLFVEGSAPDSFSLNAQAKFWF